VARTSSALILKRIQSRGHRAVSRFASGAVLPERIVGNKGFRIFGTSSNKGVNNDRHCKIAWMRPALVTPFLSDRSLMRMRFSSWFQIDGGFTLSRAARREASRCRTRNKLGSWSLRSRLLRVGCSGRGRRRIHGRVVDRIQSTEPRADAILSVTPYVISQPGGLLRTFQAHCRIYGSSVILCVPGRPAVILSWQQSCAF
jgi:hypothetical protein